MSSEPLGKVALVIGDELTAALLDDNLRADRFQVVFRQPVLYSSVVYSTPDVFLLDEAAAAEGIGNHRAGAIILHASRPGSAIAIHSSLMGRGKLVRWLARPFHYPDLLAILRPLTREVIELRNGRHCPTCGHLTSLAP